MGEFVWDLANLPDRKVLCTFFWEFPEQTGVNPLPNSCQQQLLKDQTAKLPYQIKVFVCRLQNDFSEIIENVHEKCLSYASVTLTCVFIVTRPYHERMFHLFSGKQFDKVALTTCKVCLFVR